MATSSVFKSSDSKLSLNASILNLVAAGPTWKKFPLALTAIEYAALDAWAGLKIYQEMKATGICT